MNWPKEVPRGRFYPCFIRYKYSKSISVSEWEKPAFKKNDFGWQCDLQSSLGRSKWLTLNEEPMSRHSWWEIKSYPERRKTQTCCWWDRQTDNGCLKARSFQGKLSIKSSNILFPVDVKKKIQRRWRRKRFPRLKEKKFFSFSTASTIPPDLPGKAV